MKDEEIARLRLRQQRLLGPPLPTPEAVIGWLGAVQSQEFALAKWSLARRSRGAISEVAVDRAFAEGRILRTHVLRPTWHFVLPADLRWMVGLTAPRVYALTAYYYRQLGIDEPQVRRAQVLLRRALAGGQHLTRKEIAVCLAGGGVRAEGPHLACLLMRAELDLLVCSGAPRGKLQTYALVEERVPPAPPLSRDEALAELTRRYFFSHGPATLKDFLWWSSLTAADARRGLEMVGRDLQQLVAGGRTYWLPARPARAGKTETPAVHLLQAYDEYVVAYTESKPVLAVAGLPRQPPGAALFPNAIVHDGQVVGHWRRVLAAKQTTVEARLRGPLGREARRGLQEELERFGSFRQQPAPLVLR